MLKEHRATSARYDEGADAFVVTASSISSHAKSADALLDASGQLVGIDFGGIPREVVMLGPHESVANTKSVRVSISSSEVRIHDASKHLPVADRNPYL